MNVCECCLFSQSFYSFWHQTLYTTSNGSGLLSRDPASEALIGQIFGDIVKRDLEQRNKVFGLAILDPVWLYPIGPVRFRKKGVIKGTVTACDLRLHNMKVINKNGKACGQIEN